MLFLVENGCSRIQFDFLPNTTYAPQNFNKGGFYFRELFELPEAVSSTIMPTPITPSSAYKLFKKKGFVHSLLEKNVISCIRFEFFTQQCPYTPEWWEGSRKMSADIENNSLPSNNPLFGLFSIYCSKIDPRVIFYYFKKKNCLKTNRLLIHKH